MKIEITPNEHKGWKLEWREDHENRNNFMGTKGSAMLFGDTPTLLIRKIDEKELVRARLKPPLKILFRGHYDSAFAPATLHTVCNHECYVTRSDGKEETVLLHDLKPGEYTSRAVLIHDTKANRSILDRGSKLKRQAQEIDKKSVAIGKTVKYVTEADILIAAK